MKNKCKDKTTTTNHRRHKDTTIKPLCRVPHNIRYKCQLWNNNGHVAVFCNRYICTSVGNYGKLQGNHNYTKHVLRGTKLSHKRKLAFMYREVGSYLYSIVLLLLLYACIEYYQYMFYTYRLKVKNTEVYVPTLTKNADRFQLTW